ncbi:glycosyltransferase [Sphingomonas kaistensis]|uniref:Glycosyltransferase n=1 Tax=Sphingomonas kaistensis TaxID=298708 RepID=A0ABZ2G3N2_9SPHN
MAAPAVSVLIIVHNRAGTIGAAVRSVLAQTFTDFELVVVDDGSTDATADVVARFADPRLRLVRTSPNQGIPLARNRALADARGRYIAWLDSDDVCHPTRLQVQYDYLERTPHVAMIGSAARKIRADGTLMRTGRMPARSHEAIRALLLFRSAFQQSSIFGRAEAIKAYPYDLDFPVCEDVDMFVRFTASFRAENLPQFLIARRIHADQTIRSNSDRIIERQMAISARQLEVLGVTFDESDLRRHVLLGKGRHERDGGDLLAWADGWSQTLLAANAKCSVFDQKALRACLERLIVKFAVGRLRDRPVKVGGLLRQFAAHPHGALALARESLVPLIPFAAHPPAAGIQAMSRA